MGAKQRMAELREAAPTVLPSLLLCDFGNLQREVERLQEAGVQALHLDVMDGHFVPNLTYGMPIVEALRRLTQMTLDVHLMIQHPRDYVQRFIDAGADNVTVHVETLSSPAEVLDSIRASGVGAGLALNPGTPLDAVLPHLDQCDLVLVMSVDAGFGGQTFNPVALEKLRQLRRSSGSFLLEVDGGVNGETIRGCREAGADLFVVGSAIFGKADYGAAVADLRERVRPPVSS